MTCILVRSIIRGLGIDKEKIMTRTFRNSYPKAKKQHKCDYCGEIIEIGEVYSYWVGTFEGYFQANKMHLECSKALNSSGEPTFEYHAQERGR